MTLLSGPMFEPAEHGFWQSIHKKQGAHYNTYGCDEENGMEALREMFPDGEANELNFVLFSTSGIHGMYTRIEEVESKQYDGEDFDEEDVPQAVTFLIVHPRIVCLRYGNCRPKTKEDFEFLKKLRKSSWEMIQQIGI